MATWTLSGSGTNFGQNWVYGTSGQGGGLIVGSASSEPSDFIGSTLNSVSYRMSNAVNPSPAVDTYCKVYNSSGTVVATSNATSSDNFSTSESDMLYTFSAPYHTIASGDRIVIWLPNNTTVGASNDWLQYCNSSNGTAYATFTETPLSFNTRSGRCPNCTITYGGSAPPSSDSVLLPPPVAWI